MRVLVTGSADGLGHYAADSLLSGGHNVVVHARNRDRAASLESLTDRGADLVIGDFTDREAVRGMASQLNGGAPLDSVIHNAGVEHGTAVMPVNIVAPYLLTVLLKAPQRHVYISSSSHFSGRPSLEGVGWKGDTPGSYADSKLFVTVLAAAFARLRPEVLSNAVDPGWVATKMGGPGAPDILTADPRPRFGSRQATSPQPSQTAGTGTTGSAGNPTGQCMTMPFRSNSCRTWQRRPGSCWATNKPGC